MMRSRLDTCRSFKADILKPVHAIAGMATHDSVRLIPEHDNRRTITLLPVDVDEDANRKRQRRLMVQKEQAERSRHRVELKIKQNQLQQELAAKKDRQEHGTHHLGRRPAPVDEGLSMASTRSNLATIVHAGPSYDAIIQIDV